MTYRAIIEWAYETETYRVEAKDRAEAIRKVLEATGCDRADIRSCKRERERAGQITATIANRDAYEGGAYGVVRVDGDGLRFYVWDVWRDDDGRATGMVVAGNVRATTDLRRPLTRSEWDEEYGGLGSFDEVADAVEAAR